MSWEILPYAIGPIITAKEARNNTDPIVQLKSQTPVSIFVQGTTDD